MLRVANRCILVHQPNAPGAVLCATPFETLERRRLGAGAKSCRTHGTTSSAAPIGPPLTAMSAVSGWPLAHRVGADGDLRRRRRSIFLNWILAVLLLGSTPPPPFQNQ